MVDVSIVNAAEPASRSVCVSERDNSGDSHNRWMVKGTDASNCQTRSSTAAVCGDFRLQHCSQTRLRRQVGRPQGSRTGFLRGELYKAGRKTAAHRTLPFGSQVKVTNVRNGKSVVVRINDRGPFVRGRVIDLSRSAFASIGDVSAGLLNVRIEVIR